MEVRDSGTDGFMLEGGVRGFMYKWESEEGQCLLSPPKSVLDAGCGGGTLLKALAQNEYKNLHGVDVRPKIESSGIINIHSADMCSLPFEDNHFDVVITSNVFDDFFYKEQTEAVRLKMLQEIQRVLKPGAVYLYEEADFKKIDISCAQINRFLKNEAVSDSSSGAWQKVI